MSTLYPVRSGTFCVAIYFRNNKKDDSIQITLYLVKERPTEKAKYPTRELALSARIVHVDGN